MAREVPEEAPEEAPSTEARGSATIASSQFDIGPGRKKDRGQPVYLKADQLTEHLKSEKKKALAVVWLDKSIMESTDDVVQVRSGEAMLLLEEIGYRRGIVLGADPQGIHCLSDKINEE